MAYENKPGDGALYKNKRKNSDKAPEYTGYYYDQNMEKCDIAAWLRESRDTGEKFFSLSVKLEPWKPDNAGEEPQDQPQSDDVPF